MSILDLFCSVDAFWQAFEPPWEREQLAATSQTVPNQLKQPTDRPTMRWIFQCFECMSLATFQPLRVHHTGSWRIWSRCTRDGLPAASDGQAITEFRIAVSSLR